MRRQKRAFGSPPAATLQNTGSKIIRLFILIDPVKCHAKNSLKHMVRFSSIPHGLPRAHMMENWVLHMTARLDYTTQWHGLSDAQITRNAWPFCVRTLIWPANWQRPND